jgi:hypothetical protein
MCPQERLVFISNTTGLSFALERIEPLAAIVITVFYLLILYLSALSNTPENPFASIYSYSLIKTACQHLLLLVGFDTLISQKYYDTPPDEGMTPRSSIFAYLVPAKEEARSKDTRSPQGPALRLGVEGKKYL